MARYRVDVPSSGQAVQAIAPWPVYGLRIANGTDVDATVTDDAGRTYTARPGGVWAGDTPATVTFTSRLAAQPTTGQCVVWLYDRPGEAQAEGGGGGPAPIAGSGDVGEWDRLVEVNWFGTGQWISYTAAAWGARQIYQVQAGQRVRIGPAWLQVRRTGVTASVASRYVALTVTSRGSLKPLLQLEIPAGYQTIGAASLWAGSDDLGYYGEPTTTTTFDCHGGFESLAPDPNLQFWAQAMVHVLRAAA